MLSDSESEDSGGQTQLTINEAYAKAYALRKEGEELSNLRDKYGDDALEDGDEEDSESDTDEDEDGEELTPNMDAAILRTLRRIREGSPTIYDASKNVFDEESQRISTSSKRSRKTKEARPLKMREHRLNAILDGDASRSASPEPLTHVQEQEALRKETISAFHDEVDFDSEDDLLVAREKNQDELQQEEEEYKAFLEREVGSDIRTLIDVETPAVAEDAEIPQVEPPADNSGSKKKRKKKVKTKEQSNQEFLLDYILNRGWVDKSSRTIPTYEQVTRDENKRVSPRRDPENGLQDDSDEFDDVVDLFESTYNFRYEEPGGSAVATFPRQVGETVRREDNATRKAARDRRKERKEAEQREKKEEVRRLRQLKDAELRRQIARVRGEGGFGEQDNDDERDDVLGKVIEGDWDPDAHDANMAALYEGDGANFDDEGKPVWDDDIDIGDIVPPQPESDSRKKKKKKKKKGGEEEEAGVDVDAMDADMELNREVEEELDKLEFNDIVAGVPTRFHYATVLPDSFGLSATDILRADDAVLNEYVGLKKLAPYRKKRYRVNDPKKLQDFKSQFKRPRETELEDASEPAEPKSKKKRKGRKERLRMKETAAVEVDD